MRKTAYFWCIFLGSEFKYVSRISLSPTPLAEWHWFKWWRCRPSWQQYGLWSNICRSLFFHWTTPADSKGPEWFHLRFEPVKEASWIFRLQAKGIFCVRTLRCANKLFISTPTCFGISSILRDNINVICVLHRNVTSECNCVLCGVQTEFIYKIG